MLFRSYPSANTSILRGSWQAIVIRLHSCLRAKVIARAGFIWLVLSVLGRLGAMKSRQLNRLTDARLCVEKQRLTDAFLSASHELMELQHQQTRAVIEQDPDFSRFDDLMHIAREQKDKAKYALIAHISEHRC